MSDDVFSMATATMIYIGPDSPNRLPDGATVLGQRPSGVGAIVEYVVCGLPATSGKAVASQPERSPMTTADRGFASLTPERRQQIAAQGGAAVPAHKRSFATNRELAAAAGKKGGEAGRTHPKKA